MTGLTAASSSRTIITVLFFAVVKMCSRIWIFGQEQLEMMMTSKFFTG